MREYGVGVYEYVRGCKIERARRCKNEVHGQMQMEHVSARTVLDYKHEVPYLILAVCVFLLNLQGQQYHGGSGFTRDMGKILLQFILPWNAGLIVISRLLQISTYTDSLTKQPVRENEQWCRL